MYVLSGQTPNVAERTRGYDISIYTHKRSNSNSRQGENEKSAGACDSPIPALWPVLWLSGSLSPPNNAELLVALYSVHANFLTPTVAISHFSTVDYLCGHEDVCIHDLDKVCIHVLMYMHVCNNMLVFQLHVHRYNGSGALQVLFISRPCNGWGLVSFRLVSSCLLSSDARRSVSFHSTALLVIHSSYYIHA